MRMCKVYIIAVMFVLMFVFVSCGDSDESARSVENAASYTENTLYVEHPLNLMPNKVTGGEIIGDYQYPKNPAEQLRTALKNDIDERGLPMAVSEVENLYSINCTHRRNLL